MRVFWPMPPAWSMTFAMPKSRIFGVNLPTGSRAKITFSGFKSRCTIPCAWAMESPWSNPWTMVADCIKGTRPPLCV